MQKKEPKTCIKCGEHYFGEECVGCHSNQYTHYNANSSMKNKLFIALAFCIIVGLIVLNR